MIIGLSVETFTQLHVLISLIGIVTGLVALLGMLASKRPDGWTKAFLITTILTTATGFMFPIIGFTPALATGVAAAAVLALAVLAYLVFNLNGRWRAIYVIAAVAALWLNCFVLVVQTFQKIEFVSALAPTQTEPPFLVAQVLVLGLFVVLGALAVKRFHPTFQAT